MAADPRTPRDYRVASIPGDGIGVEVSAQARRVIDAIGGRHGFAVEWTDLDWSCQRYLTTGAMIPGPRAGPARRA